MGFSPTVKGWFDPPNAALPLAHLMVADILLFVIGSAIAAWALWKKRSWARAICWFMVGATLYASLICLQGAITGSMRTLCFVLMIPAGLLTIHATMIGCGDQGFPFQVYRGNRPSTALLVALFETAIFYTMFFGVIPATIVYAQHELDLTPFNPGAPGRIAAIVGFLAGGTLAISSTVQFAWKGMGTPLPMYAPKQLVISGPYRYVRNPMAVGGIFQGVMVGIFLGSVPVMVYSLMGAGIWHFFIRPVEEADLQDRFGNAFTDYCQQVKCWWPSRAYGSSTPSR